MNSINSITSQPAQDPPNIGATVQSDRPSERATRRCQWREYGRRGKAGKREQQRTVRCSREQHRRIMESRFGCNAEDSVLDFFSHAKAFTCIVECTGRKRECTVVVVTTVNVNGRHRRRRRHCRTMRVLWHKCLEGNPTKEALALECESAEGANDGSGRCAF